LTCGLKTCNDVSLMCIGKRSENERFMSEPHENNLSESDPSESNSSEGDSSESDSLRVLRLRVSWLSWLSEPEIVTCGEGALRNQGSV
jgi:hypothetical protein